MPLDNFRLTVLLAISLHAAFAGVRVSLSLFALSLKASPFTVGVILSLLALLPTLFSVHAGRGIDRIGVRRPLLIGAGSVMGGTRPDQPRPVSTQRVTISAKNAWAVQPWTAARFVELSRTR